MGFDIEVVRNVMKNSQNDMNKAIASLLEMQADGTYNNLLQQIRDTLPNDTAVQQVINSLPNDIAVASTSAVNKIVKEEKVRQVPATK